MMAPIGVLGKGSLPGWAEMSSPRSRAAASSGPSSMEAEVLTAKLTAILSDGGNRQRTSADAGL